MGLMATSNWAPPSVDFRAFKAGQDFRAIAFGSVHVDVDGPTGTVTVSHTDSLAEVGFTPPFSFQKLRQNGAIVGPADELAIERELPAVVKTIHAGEISPLSSVVVGARHVNTAIDNVPDDPVLANALVKVRASAAEDASGVALPEPGVPFHVPWVWCEVLLTNAGDRNVNLFARGSTFPSHAFYVNGSRIDLALQAFHASYLVFPGTSLLRESDMIMPAFFQKGGAGVRLTDRTQQ